MDEEVEVWKLKKKNDCSDVRVDECNELFLLSQSIHSFGRASRGISIILNSVEREMQGARNDSRN